MNFMRVIFVVCVAAALADCGGGATAVSPSQDALSPALRAQAEGAKAQPAYGVIYSFKGPPYDGEQPYSSLAKAGSTLYGTTAQGGSTDNGTTFAISIGLGKETQVYSFGGAGNGSDPKAGVSVTGGAVYGTTTGGGSTNGTVFTISSSQLSTIHQFQGGKYDGAVPTADLAYVASTDEFYSTTASGGTYGQGTVFEVAPSGSEQILYSFQGLSKGDGATPVSGLHNSGGTFYGTTEWGGKHNKGTLYTVSLTGQERVLYSFGSSTGDGEFPRAAPFVSASGTLFGTTDDGGAYGKGTVYKFSSGKLSIVHSFSGASDGAYPTGGILVVNGVLYGTTSGAGIHGGGTVFKIDAGKESVIHDFPAFSGDGKWPARKLSYINGKLYGTTKSGGTGTCPGSGGCGTVFAIAP